MQNKYRDFVPKSFVSRRRDASDKSRLFEHRAEDYMDDEDFGEFGIAPKKIRLAGDFSSAENWANPPGPAFSRSKPESIGERILRNLIGCDKKGRFEDSTEPVIKKNDYYGLGYQPLKHKTSLTVCENPLEATLSHGRKLKISGHAFGIGVLDDDDEVLHQIDEYGYENITSYKFNHKSRISDHKHSRDRNHQLDESSSVATSSELNDLNDFTLAADVEAGQIHEKEHSKYPLPAIESDWVQPKRESPYVPPDREERKQDISKFRNQLSEFNVKFTAGVSHDVGSDSISARTGLISYSDLRNVEPKQSGNVSSSNVHVERPGISISRHIVEWRPCSLLCKHFDVANPYPDNSFFGVKPTDLSTPKEAIINEVKCQPAPLELRRSIFNVTWDEANEESDVVEFSDEEPQLVHIESPESKMEVYAHIDTNQSASRSDEETDVILIEATKSEPELIVLSSSSSSPAAPTSGYNDRSSTDSDNDAYGPPLPPSRVLIQSLVSKDTKTINRSRHDRHREKSKKSKKSRRVR